MTNKVGRKLQATINKNQIVLEEWFFLITGVLSKMEMMCDFLFFPLIFVNCSETETHDEVTALRKN